MTLPAKANITCQPKTVPQGMHFADTVVEIRTGKINSLMVTEQDGTVLGKLHIYDLVADETST